MALRNWRTPVDDTRKAGVGSLSGTIRIKSDRVRGWKCEIAVNTNIAANATRSAPVQESASGHRPVVAINRESSQTINMKMSGATCDGPTTKIRFRSAACLERTGFLDFRGGVSMRQCRDAAPGVAARECVGIHMACRAVSVGAWLLVRPAPSSVRTAGHGAQGDTPIPPTCAATVD